MEDQEKRISYGASITRSPSDFLCGEGELAECIGLTSDGEELKVLTPLTEKISAQDTHSRKLVFVHKLENGTQNLIYDGGSDLYYNNSSIEGTSHTNVKSITAIGNTIIASLDGKLWYGLFKGTEYKDVTKIPAPIVEFRMGMDSSADPNNYQKGYSVVNSTGSPYGIVGYGPGGQQDYFYIKTDEGGGQDKYNNLVAGLYYKNLKTIKEKMGFAEPFCARVALELYDGSYTCITNPVMLLPAVTKNSSAYNAHNIFTVYTNYSLLYCWLKNDYSDYNDIVKDVVVFISDGVNIYDTTVDQPSDANRLLYEADSGDVLTNCVAYNTNDNRSELTETTKGTARRWMVLKERPKKEIEDDLARQSIFYRLCSLGTSVMSGFAGVADKISVHTLETLTTQEQLKYDDFYSFCQLKADFLYSYNNRLNAAGIKRGFFGGFDFFIAYDNSSSHTYTAYVTIKTPEGEKVIAHTYTTKQQQGIWFYYPDPRASHVYIDNGGSCVCDADLTEHPGLNGAFYFKGLLTVEATPTGTHTAPTATVSPQEDLGGYLLTSEVNNPFIFRASGYNRVGAGTIVGMATQTQALSQGQFGTYPLMVFTTEGIWAMAVDFDGSYSRISPMSREVAWKDNPAITPVDGSIFFVSKKGLMVVEGSKVTCVSERLNGKAFATNGTPVEGQGLPSSIGSLGQDISECSDSSPFLNFLLSLNLRIAYDYMDSRLLLINNTGGRMYCWVYSMKTGGFSKMVIGNVNNVVNNYPDYLMQSVSSGTPGTPGAVYTLYEKVREETVMTRQRGFLLTRPLKLGGALTVASLRKLINVGYWDKGVYQSVRALPANPSDGDVICPIEDIVVGTEPNTVTYKMGCYYKYKESTTSWELYNGISWVKTMILVSDDLVNWYEDNSRFGAGAKYFRIALFVNMLPTERLSGTILTERGVRKY